MRLKSYSREECDRFNGATGILGEVTAICSELAYYHATTEEEKKAIWNFELPYGTLRINLTMRETEKIDWIYKKVKPLISGKNPKITLPYILSNPNNGKIF